MPLKETVESLSGELPRLGTGPLAELRRMKVGGPGVAAFWVLAGKCDFLDDTNTNTWMRIVKIMAILTPKGQGGAQRPLHDAKRRLGAVLCDGGNPDWPANPDEPRPVVSETRLARLLAQRPDQRSEALECIARMLAARRDPASGIDCIDLARLLLRPEKADLQTLARTYYQRLDAAAHKSSQEGTRP